MWITQTYLKSPEPDAKLHLYYLFKNYVDGQKEASKWIEKELENFSRSVPDACIIFPSERSRPEIEFEQRNQGILEKLDGALPGVLVSRKPLENLDIDNDELFYVQLNHEGFSEDNMHLQARRFVPYLKQLMEITTEQLHIVDREPSQFEFLPIALRLWRAIEIKPGIMGFAVDVKKIFDAD